MISWMKRVNNKYSFHPMQLKTYVGWCIFLVFKNNFLIGYRVMEIKSWLPNEVNFICFQLISMLWWFQVLEHQTQIIPSDLYSLLYVDVASNFIDFDYVNDITGYENLYDFLLRCQGRWTNYLEVRTINEKIKVQCKGYLYDMNR